MEAVGGQAVWVSGAAMDSEILEHCLPFTHVSPSQVTHNHLCPNTTPAQNSSKTEPPLIPSEVAFLKALLHRGVDHPIVGPAGFSFFTPWCHPKPKKGGKEEWSGLMQTVPGLGWLLHPGAPSRCLAPLVSATLNHGEGAGLRLIGALPPPPGQASHSSICP